MKNTSLLFFSKYNQVVLKKSSMNITKYLKPLNDSTGPGPQTSE
jgi:hypothetical protein